MDVIIDLYQQGKIEAAAQRATRAAESVERMGDDIRAVGRQVEMLAITCQALWELLREQTGLRDQDVLRKVQEIDLRDGSADGKMTQQVNSCAACGRPNNSRRSACLYCGAELSQEHIFHRKA